MAQSKVKTTPNYLLPPQFCYSKTTIACFISLLTFTVILFLISKSSTLLFNTAFGQQLQLFFEVSFLLACTTALWKKSIMH